MENKFADLDAASGRAALRVKEVNTAGVSLGETLQETTAGFTRVESLFYRADTAADRLTTSQNRLENAQIRLQEAQGRLNNAISQWGLGSQQARDASNDLTIAQNELHNSQLGVDMATRRQQATYLLMIPTIIDLTRDVKGYVTSTDLAAKAVSFLRDVETSEIVVKSRAAIATVALKIETVADTAIQWLHNSALATKVILLSMLTLGAFAAAAALSGLAASAAISTATASTDANMGVYTKRSPVKFLSGPLAGVTAPESGLGGISLSNVTSPLSTANVNVDFQASISKEVDAEEVGRIIGRRIAEEIRRR